MDLLTAAVILCLRICLIYCWPLSSSSSKEFVPLVDDEDDFLDILAVEMPFNDLSTFDLSVFGRTLFQMPDYNYTARKVSEYLPDESSVNPEELGSYVEGDILIPQSAVVLKNGLTFPSFRWPDAKVAYEITGNFHHRELLTIANAFNEFHRKTCIRFVPRTNETDYILIGNSQSGCWSSLGRIGGKQEINLQTPGCLSKLGTPMHELMHVLGFLHEQNRQERDAFVDIRYENIRQAAYDNFKKVPATLAFGVPYDYGSIMHYSAKAFSRNGQVTIKSKVSEGSHMMGQRDGLSPLDIEKINRMYNCWDSSKTEKPFLEMPKSSTRPQLRAYGKVY